MADAMGITMDTSEVEAAFARLGDRAVAHMKPKAKISADNIAREAERRVKRRTGETARGIQVHENRAGDGYVVSVTNRRMPNLPLWIEGGTRRGDPGSHAQPADPFLYPAAQLEERAHEDRLMEGLQDALDEAGLGS